MFVLARLLYQSSDQPGLGPKGTLFWVPQLTWLAGYRAGIYGLRTDMAIVLVRSFHPYGLRPASLLNKQVEQMQQTYWFCS